MRAWTKGFLGPISLVLWVYDPVYHSYKWSRAILQKTLCHDWGERRYSDHTPRATSFGNIFFSKLKGRGHLEKKHIWKLRSGSLNYIQNPTLSHYLHHYHHTAFPLSPELLHELLNWPPPCSLFKHSKLLDCCCITPNGIYFNPVPKVITEHTILISPTIQDWSTHLPTLISISANHSSAHHSKPFHSLHEIVPGTSSHLLFSNPTLTICHPLLCSHIRG